MSSLDVSAVLAKAGIMVLRVSARRSAMRAWYHRQCAVLLKPQKALGAPELTALDQAIGDGDGDNMKRGFEAVLGKVDVITAQPLSEAVKTVGKRLVMTVGEFGVASLPAARVPRDKGDTGAVTYSISRSDD